MLEFLHTNIPNPIFWQFGSITIRWYSVCIVLGFLFGLFLTLRLAKAYRMDAKVIYDMAFYVLFFGLIGDRLYYVLYAWEYYQDNLWDIFKIWEGGLAIHGGIIAGIATLLLFARYSQGRESWKNWAQERHLIPEKSETGTPWRTSLFFCFFLADIAVIALLSGLALGRFGNYFNQELFGTPTDLPWGIPIDPFFVPDVYAGEFFFHPTFLYESVADILILIILFFLHRQRLKQIQRRESNSNASNEMKKPLRIAWGDIALIGLSLYSGVRILNEFLRTDYSPYVFGIRWAQIMSGLIILICFAIFSIRHYRPWKRDKSHKQLS